MCTDMNRRGDLICMGVGQVCVRPILRLAVVTVADSVPTASILSHGGVWRNASAGLCRAPSLAQPDVILSSPFQPRVGLSGPGEFGRTSPGSSIGHPQP